jgi:hypothetical protein
MTNKKLNSHLWWDSPQRWKSQQKLSKACRLIWILSTTVFLERALRLFLKWLDVWHVGKATSIYIAGERKRRKKNVKIEMFGYSECGGEKRVQNCLGTFLFSINQRKLCQNHFSPFHLPDWDFQFTMYIVYCSVIREWWTRGWLDLMFALD